MENYRKRENLVYAESEKIYKNIQDSYETYAGMASHIEGSPKALKEEEERIANEILEETDFLNRQKEEGETDEEISKQQALVEGLSDMISSLERDREMYHAVYG